jgi:hypothetical protein
MADEENHILTTLLDRLYGTLVHGPCLNCRVHRSRQRVDLFDITALQHLSIREIVPQVVAGGRKVEIRGKVPVYRGPEKDEDMDEKDRASKAVYEGQMKLLTRLRGIAEDALTYEQETGENALYIGYPFVSLPPGNDLIGAGSPTSRIVAPVALIAVDLVVKRGAVQSVTIAARGEGTDLVIPNYPFLAWLENQTGKDLSELFSDEEGADPYRELNEIAVEIEKMLQFDELPTFAPDLPFEAIPETGKLPNKPVFLNAAALGLFPVSNQGLLRDLKAMVGGEAISGPVEYFLSAQADGSTAETEFTPEKLKPMTRDFATERLVAQADPFQARAVHEAENHPCLVIHGPPGTGKSQTITNIIGDHLARGERVLMVCDKRTAIDVVYNRLEHLGLADLCALVHDPQKDQRSLYMKIRNYLDTLPEQKTNSRVKSRLNEIDTELSEIHAEVLSYFKSLNLAGVTGQKSFHNCVGEWFAIEAVLNLSADRVEGFTLDDVEAVKPNFCEALDRAQKVSYAENPWTSAAGIELSTLMSSSVAELRAGMAELVVAAQAFDKTVNADGLLLDPQVGLEHQAHDRETLGADLIRAEKLNRNESIRRWLERGISEVGEALHKLQTIRPALDEIQQSALDAELSLNLAGGLPPLTLINTGLVTLAHYAEIADKWYNFVYFGRKSAAEKVLTGYGLPVDKSSANRVSKFLAGIKSRLLVRDHFESHLHGHFETSSLPRDEEILDRLQGERQLLLQVKDIQGNGQYAFFGNVVNTAFGEGGESVCQLDEALRNSAAYARRVFVFVACLNNSGLLTADWLGDLDQSLRKNERAGDVIEQLSGRFDSLEDVLRVRHAFAQIPPQIQPAAKELMGANVGGEDGINVLRKELLQQDISQRIREDKFLQQVDAERVNNLLKRYSDLLEMKRKWSQELIRYEWTCRQQEQLVDKKRGQVNAAGADMKRRLITRGKRSLKLRQMIQYGRAQGKDDPLFNLCPVWMASPATVALIFPRLPIFDVIIFDEASQCRLEEAIPVLTRGKRVVIAGDPKQLPPTRFFESAIAETEVEEVSGEQDLFEQQQADTEDLLTAALNLRVRQSYLDVHYRSHHESLIGFSNEHFYRNRLQPIPSHPSTRTGTPAVELYRVDGVYSKRRNVAEAQRVVEIVRELLATKKPPSIGVACFNMVQRELILDRLEEEADKDKEFGERFETARSRWGEGSFEGLFVKNLENVQGDERDHMIISTTFGPDANGRFIRNFGPIGHQGGGRRLNVLVTRARRKIHVLTSIPRTEYRILPELEDKQSPSGRWLLYAYLNYAERLAETRRQELQLEAAEMSDEEAVVHVGKSVHPSSVAEWLANNMASENRQSSDVHWGNDGFCVDVAFHHSQRSDQRALGVLCDLHRFADTPDLVDWEVFRTQLLEGKGWKFQRVFSPAMFRDWERSRAEIIEEAAKVESKLKLPELIAPDVEPEPEAAEDLPDAVPVVFAEPAPMILFESVPVVVPDAAPQIESGLLTHPIT